MMLSPAEPGTTDQPSPPGRAPPHNLECEQALLGAILVQNAAFERVCDLIKPSDFFEPLHGRIYSVIGDLISQGRLATPLTLKPFFECEPPVGDMPVWQYLGRLVVNAVSIISAKDYAGLIRELAMRRTLIIIGEDMVNSAYEAHAIGSSTTLIEEAESRLFSVAEANEQGDVAPFRSVMARAVEAANTAHKLQGRLRGISTGLVDLDNKLGGMARSDLIILAGRPSMGKTALATNIAWHVATHPFTDTDGIEKAAPVGFFSLEMRDEQLVTRILAEETGFASHRISRGLLSNSEIEDVIRRGRELDAPLYIDQRGGISIAQLTARARRMKRLFGIELLVVDYLQLLQGSKKERVQELTQITTGLKALAKELDIPVLALSQLSRQVEGRTDKRPQLSDLRESGSIEQDADVVMFVFREEYYLERAKPSDDGPEFSEWQRKFLASQGLAEVIIGKQRHGPTGTVSVAFDGGLTKFSNLARAGEVPP